MSYLAGLVILLVPYWLGPILVWLTQKVRAEAAFEPFAPERHAGFHVVADLFQTGQVKRVSTRAVFPRSDPYEILRLMGTNGWNYDIGPDSIVAWLRALERDHPLVLTGIGFDWVEGRFRSAIDDADALARRIYAFCPDVVDQRTETVDALARELGQSPRLYCWWD